MTSGIRTYNASVGAREDSVAAVIGKGVLLRAFE
jgi:hypothetical protein